MANSQQMKFRLSMAGEFGAASELLKHGFNATVTYGNAKATDIIILNDDCDTPSYKRIEVKTTKDSKFVTNFFQKYGDKSRMHPDYWVLVHIDSENISEFYILTHQQLGEIQMQRNNMTEWQCVPDGCDSVLLSSVNKYKNNWETITL